MRRRGRLRRFLDLGRARVELGQEEVRALLGRDDRGLPKRRDGIASRKDKQHRHQQEAGKEVANLLV